MQSWDQRLFGLCDLLATWSEDGSRKVGAVVVGAAHEIRSTGFNGLPRGVNGAVEARHSREEGEKYLWFEHAERNAIYNAALIGVSLRGCTLYASVYPCADCARAIIQSGVSRVKTRKAPANDATYARSFAAAETMLREAGVAVELVEG